MTLPSSLLSSNTPPPLSSCSPSLSLSCSAFPPLPRCGWCSSLAVWWSCTQGLEGCCECLLKEWEPVDRNRLKKNLQQEDSLVILDKCSDFILLCLYFSSQSSWRVFTWGRTDKPVNYTAWIFTRGAMWAVLPSADFTQQNCPNSLHSKPRSTTRIRPPPLSLEPLLSALAYLSGGTFLGVGLWVAPWSGGQTAALQHHGLPASDCSAAVLHVAAGKRSWSQAQRSQTKAVIQG